MEGISEYLKRLSTIIGGGIQKKQALIEEIKTHIGVELSRKAIEIKEVTAVITASPITKNSIFLKKKLILQALEKKGFHFVDIR